MSINIPSTYSPVVPLEITPGEPILSATWVEHVERLHHLYSRSGTRIPLYWGDGVSSTSSTFERPGALSGLTGVWRPTRVLIGATYRISVFLYGSDAEVRVRLYDARDSADAEITTADTTLPATPSWVVATVELTDAQALDGSLDPLSIGIDLQIRRDTTQANLYQAFAVCAPITSGALLPSGAPVVGTDPESLTSLVEYLDARDLVGVISDFGSVSSWPSAISGGTSATQATASRQPILIEDYLSTGMAGVAFDGVADAMAYPIDIAPGWTVLAFVTFSSDTNGHYFMDASSGRMVLSMRIPDLGIDEPGVYDGGASWISAGVPGPTTGTHAYTWTQEVGGQVKVYAEDIEIMDSSATARSLSGTVVLGSRFTQNFTFLSGAIHGVWVFDEPLDATTIGDVLTYINNDWSRP